MQKAVDPISCCLNRGSFAAEGSFQLVLLHLTEARQVRRALCAFHPSLACLHPCHPSGLFCWHQTTHSCGALAKPGWKSLSAWPTISSPCLQCLCGNNSAAGQGSAEELCCLHTPEQLSAVAKKSYFYPAPAIDEADVAEWDCSTGYGQLTMCVPTDL